MRRAGAVFAVALAARVACARVRRVADAAPRRRRRRWTLRGQTHVEIDAKDNAFVPADVTVSRGTTVIWKNDDTTAHDIHPPPNEPKFGVGVGEFGPGAQHSFAFTKVGVYPYTCTVHTNMNGVVRVVAQ